MKVKVLREVEVSFLKVNAHVRYAEDADVNGVEDSEGTLMPCMEGENWCPIIDMETGIVQNWPQGTKAEIHYKVCDEGSYYLLDSDSQVIASIEEDYVPSILCPKEAGYGDYIIMDIDENGQIADWDNSDISEFENLED